MGSSPTSVDSGRPSLFGSETPRIFTPPLRELTAATSLGFECIRFAEDVLEIRLLPWQKWLLIHALELRPDGLFRFRKVVLLVGRQNGKSTVLQVIALWRMYVDRCSLVIGTAQDLDTAEEVWQGAVDLAEGVEELADEIDAVVRVNGKKALRLKTGERYKVVAASRRGGRGKSGELVFLDELREHQSWDAYAAVTKTTQAKERAQIWAASNAGDAASIVLRYLRKMAHAALGDPDGINAEAGDEPTPDLEDDEDVDDLADDLGIFEWSAPPGCAISDRSGWAQGNPSLGHLILERVIAGDSRTDPEWVFRTEVLCQWSSGTLEGPFPAGAWDKARDSSYVLPADGRVGLCVDVSWNRSMTYIGLAGFRDDGVPQVEVVAQRAGTDWVVPWLTSLDRTEAVKAAAVAVQKSGAPASSLIVPLQDAGINVVELSGSELGAACGGLYDRVRACVGEGTDSNDVAVQIRHRGQPVLDVAAATAATRPLGESWVWDRKHSPNDVAPLVAVTGALRVLDTEKEPVEPWVEFA